MTYIKDSKKLTGFFYYVASGSAGSFLEPPYKKCHRYEVVQKHAGNVMSICSIDSFKKEFPELAAKVDSIIGEEKQTPIDENWKNSVFNYYNNCYSSDGVNSNASDCIILEEETSLDYKNKYHLAVLFIRKYYPDFIATEEDFLNHPEASWGKKEGV